MCATLRRAARALTQLYEQEMRSSGLSTSQFTILQVLSLISELTQGELGRLLVMDSTTLTRTLAIMSRRGWIKKRHGHDRREWRIALAKTGQEQLRRALPLWERAQVRVRRQMGKGPWSELTKLTNQLTNQVAESGD